jgi:16S rRNA (cytosine967-C5)-methyltransferase
MTARELAAEVLRRGREEHVFASDALDDVSNVSPQDRRLATQLTLGTIRRQATLDALIRPFLQRPLDQVEPEVRDVLRLGTYQLALMGGIPPHAAVHESVELVRFVRKPRAVGLVNGVLRRVSELVTDDFVDEWRTDTIPLDLPSIQPNPPSPFPKREGGDSSSPSLVGRGWGLGEVEHRYHRINRPLLPTPHIDPIAALAIGFSWPHWLADRWFGRFGLDECVRLGFWFNAVPPLWLRVKALKGTRSEYLHRLNEAGFEAEPGEAPHSLKLSGGSIRDLPGYADGDFAVQDHASQLVAAALNPQPDFQVLDLCAAPGGKTTHLAELMGNRGRIVACDIDARRLETVTTLCQRLGVTIVEPRLIGEGIDPPDGPFDAALVDAPCSNSGVLGRRPEVRWRIKPAEYEHLVRLQSQLLDAAVRRVKPGGTIVYSTCSIEPMENRGVVEAVCRTVRGLTIEMDSTAIPGMPGDGGYWARLIKR